MSKFVVSVSTQSVSRRKNVVAMSCYGVLWVEHIAYIFKGVSSPLNLLWAGVLFHGFSLVLSVDGLFKDRYFGDAKDWTILLTLLVFRSFLSSVMFLFFCSSM